MVRTEGWLHLTRQGQSESSSFPIAVPDDEPLTETRLAELQHSEQHLAALPQLLANWAADTTPEFRAALHALSPWICLWLFRVQTIASRLQRLPTEHWSELHAIGLDKLERFVISEWACTQNLTVRFEHAPSPSDKPQKASEGVPQPRSLLPVLRSPGTFKSDHVVVSLQGNSTQAVLPIAEELRTLGASPHFLLLGSDSTSLKLVADAGFSHTFLEQHLPWTTPVHLGSAYFRLRSFFRSAEFRRWLEGFPSPGFLATTGTLKVFSELALKRFLPAHLKAMALGRALGRSRALTVLYASDHSLVASLTRDMTSAKGIFFLQGVVPAKPVTHQFAPSALALVGSPLDRHYPENSGIEPEKIRFTGYASYRSFRTLSKERSRRELEELNIPSQRPLVVFTSQYPTDIYPLWARDRNLAAIAETARMMPHHHFLVKQHPRREGPSTSLQEPPSNLTILRGGIATSSLLKAADVAVTYWSTTALEAVLLGTPLVQLNATGLPDYYPLSGLFSQTSARTPAELSSRIHAITSDAGARKHQLELQQTFLNAHPIPDAEKAAGEAAQAILELVRRA